MNFSIDQNIKASNTITTDFYTSDETFEKSKEKIFAKAWMYAGDAC